MERQRAAQPRHDRRLVYSVAALMICLACLVIGVIGLSFVVDMAQEGIAAFLQSIRTSGLR